jgi:hypothetical protein
MYINLELPYSNGYSISSSVLSRVVDLPGPWTRIHIYVCTVRQYWSNSLYQGRYTRKSLWLSLASVDEYSTQYNYKNYL